MSLGTATAQAGATRPAKGVIAAAVGAILIGVLMLSSLAGGGVLDNDPAPQPADEAEGVSSLAESEIPARFLQLYLEAAKRYGLDWAILAGIGKVECDHGRDPDPACTREGSVNPYGAGGPMQFLGSTWAKYGVDADGDGRADRWDPADAIFGAANYLRASGAPQNYGAAIFAYNHSASYVADVKRWAARYRGSAAGQNAVTEAGQKAVTEAGQGIGEVAGEGADRALEGETSTPVLFITGERARLDPGDGHLALIPAGVPARVQAMIVAGNELQELPYGPGGHPDPLGAAEEDCSSSVNYVLYRSGIRPLAEILEQNPVAQDYTHWGLPGPGRWVTIYATIVPTPHVFMMIAGLRLDTSHNGTDVGPNRLQDGPRWRILNYIPTWAHWSVRHPPGL